MKYKLKPALVLLLVCMVAIRCAPGDKGSTTPVDTLAASAADTSNQTISPARDSVNTGVSKKDWLLVPGAAAGKTFLNESTEQSIKTLGTPDGGDAAMGKSVMIWYNNHDTTANSIAVYTTRDSVNAPLAKIRQIRVSSPAFKTAEGLKTGSTLSEIEKRHQVTLTEKYQDGGQPYQVYSSKDGIAFEMNAKGICVAIIIFEPGKQLPGTYLKFRTTNKLMKRS